MTSWRDVLKIHPAAELYRMRSDRLRAIGEDIKANGLRDPITIWCPGYRVQIARPTTWPSFVKNHKAALLDGRHRLDAMELDGIRTDEYRDSCYCDETGALGGLLLDDPTCVTILWGGERNDQSDLYDYVRSANAHRVHQTKEELAAYLVALAKAKAEHQASLRRDNEVSRHNGGKPKTGGRPKDLVKEKAVELGEQHDISERTIERAIAKAAGKTPQPRKPNRDVVNPATPAGPSLAPSPPTPGPVSEAPRPAADEPLNQARERASIEAALDMLVATLEMLDREELIVVIERVIANRAPDEQHAIRAALAPKVESPPMVGANLKVGNRSPAAVPASAPANPSDKMSKIQAALAEAGSDGLDVGQLYHKAGAYLTDLDIAVKQGVIRQTGEKYFA
jgi:hypothetical protein